MKVATWNLQCVRPGVRERTERIRAAIANVEADVWVLTETHERFTPGEGYSLAATSEAAPDRRAEDLWVAIWARSPIVSSQLPLVGEPERSAAARLTFGGGRSMVVAGTVLPWRSDTATELRGAAKFEASLAAQGADWERLQRLYPHDDFCLAGDFNQELFVNGYSGTVRGRVALTALLESQRLVALTAGERDPLIARRWRASIDHIVASERLASTAQAVAVWPDEFPLSRAMSDHHGVCVELCVEG